MKERRVLTQERAEEIVSWLFQEQNQGKLFTEFRNKKGYAVSGSRMIVKSDGSEVSLLDAMIADGFPNVAGTQVETDEFRIEYAPASNGYRHASMMFYKKFPPEPPVDAGGLF